MTLNVLRGPKEKVSSNFRRPFFGYLTFQHQSIQTLLPIPVYLSNKRHIAK